MAQDTNKFTNGNYFLISIFFITIIVAVITIIFGILYDSVNILLNGYSLFSIFGVLSLLLYSFNISEKITIEPGKISNIHRLMPVFTVLISVLPLMLIIVHLFNAMRLKIKYNEKGNDELYWSNVAVFFLIMVIVSGGLVLLNMYSEILDNKKPRIIAPIISGNCGLLLLSGVCMFIINKMNVYTKFYSTSG